ncbi:DDE-type integrase/transposase/recombinase [Candidatus Uhrbacteria bacterium]|nr:DDE-type integrase/transposase/recombinase [Candidatus Uhrbacteria bacterium]
MDPQTVFCPNRECLASGQVGKGNITIHSQKEKRYRCNVCKKTFVETKGTVFYRRKKTPEVITRVLILLAFGCPVQAIVQAFEWDERTVRSLQEQAGQHCEELHAQLVEQPRDLGQVQADEIWVKAQGVILWLAMAMQVSTRLWLGGAVSAHRDQHLIRAVIEHVRACALCRPLLFCVDGLSSYLTAIRTVFREPLPTGKPGRPRLRPWDGIHIAQVVKRYARRRVVGIERRIVQGAEQTIQRLVQQTQGGGVINTAYIERLNGTFRSRLAALVRRGRALPRQEASLQAGVYLMGTVYNFCTYHQSLRVELQLPGQRRRWLRRTPAIAAGITDHKWSMAELLWHKVPHPPQLPKRRGRPSKAFLALKAKWLT